tara:strand:- start:222 stop:563 length:342 start_codon:yes stop_codon:yes gene_type:complete
MSKKISYPDGIITEKNATRILKNHPERIPVIVERISKELEMDKTKFLVPTDLTLGQLQYVFRKSTRLNADKALFIYINNSVIPQTSCLVSQLYEEYKSDGFLKVSLLTENTFG